MTPTDTLFAKLIFTVMLLASLGAFVYLMRRRYQVLRAARQIDRFDRPWERLKKVLVYYLGQRRILDPKHLGAGIMHALIFWGFLAVSINSLHLIGRAYIPHFHLPLFGPESLLGAPYI
ncbi:MAG: (Fe-S)-binding protein, partial [Calditrichaeota bacterium]|nr:(Fe-S)-binding protein [Calditrichota bacterium]